MKTEDELKAFIQAHPTLAPLLKAASAITLAKCWISAGAIRNAVWDHLFGRSAPTGLNADIDVIYFNAENLDPLQDRKIEAQLIKMHPTENWSVHNQARMHLKNSDPAYADLETALEYWPETATAVAARLQQDELRLTAPFGTDDLLKGILRPNPYFPWKRAIFKDRIRTKDWKSRWPDLLVIDPDE